MSRRKLAATDARHRASRCPPSRGLLAGTGVTRRPGRGRHAAAGLQRAEVHRLRVLRAGAGGRRTGLQGTRRDADLCRHHDRRRRRPGPGPAEHHSAKARLHRASRRSTSTPRSRRCKQARQRGAVVVPFDSDVAPAGRDLFVNMAPFEVQARAMLEFGAGECARRRQGDLDRPYPDGRQLHLAEEGDRRPDRQGPEVQVDPVHRHAVRQRRSRQELLGRHLGHAGASRPQAVHLRLGHQRRRRSTRRSRTRAAPARSSRPASPCRAP